MYVTCAMPIYRVQDLALNSLCPETLKTESLNT